MPGTVGHINGTEATERAGKMIEARRRIIVHVNAGTSDTNAMTLAMIHPDVPKDGQAYSTAQPDLRLVRKDAITRSVSPAGRTIVQVDLFYEWLPFNGAIWSGGSGVEVKAVFKNNKGEELTLTNQFGHGTRVQAKALRPTTSVVVTLASGTPLVNLTNRFVGKTNGRRWNGGDIGTWLCMGVRMRKMTLIANARLGIRLYDFDIHYKQEGWMEEYRYFDAATGKFPVDSSETAKIDIDLSLGSEQFSDLIAV